MLDAGRRPAGHAETQRRRLRPAVEGEHVVRSRRPAPLADNDDAPHAIGAAALVHPARDVADVHVVCAAEIKIALHSARRRDQPVQRRDENRDPVGHLHGGLAAREQLREVAPDRDVLILRRERCADGANKGGEEKDSSRHFTSSGSLGSASSSPSRSSPFTFTLAGKCGASMISNSTPDLSGLSMTRTVPPRASLPNRISSASGFLIESWITRAKG